MKTRHFAKLARELGLSIVAINGLLAGTVRAEDEGDEFSNNLISDLAPLLTLFGEQFARQFMQHSLTFGDNILFAVAPLGIITAIVGAIRTGGPAWLRSIIGRARENDAAAEVEYMSSVSHEVCEMWNGHSVVRIPGAPQIQMFVYIERRDERIQESKHTEAAVKIPGKKDSRPTSRKGDNAPTKVSKPSKLKDRSNWSFGIYILDERCPEIQWSNYGHELSKLYKRFEAKARGDVENDRSDFPYNSLKGDIKLAPNITLNLTPKKTSQLYIGAAIGIILQLGVLVAAGFMAFHPTLKTSQTFMKGGEVVPNHAYPLFAVGTILLTVGIFICASVIEQSTQEHKWFGVEPEEEKVKKATTSNEKNGDVNVDVIPHSSLQQPKSASFLWVLLRMIKHVFWKQSTKEEKPELRVVWVQRELTINDQRFDSYALVSPRKLHSILTSHPLRLFSGTESLTSYITLRASSVIGTMISLAGFVLQFVGLRALNWITSIMQLGITVVMILVRVYVRRSLTWNPVDERLKSDHELDWLAIEMSHADFWRRYDEAAPSSPGSQSVPTTGIIKSIKNELSIALGYSQSEDLHRSRAHGYPRWKVTTAGEHTACGVFRDDKLDGEVDSTLVNSCQEILHIRKRLGALSKWAGSTEPYAISVAASIEEVLNTTELFNFKDALRIRWYMNGTIVKSGDLSKDSEKPDEERIYFTAYRSSNTSEWKTNAAEIEAAMSLWLNDAMKTEERLQKSDSKMDGDWLRASKKQAVSDIKGLQLLGPCTAQICRDLQWWVGKRGTTVHEVAFGSVDSEAKTSNPTKDEKVGHPSDVSDSSTTARKSIHSVRDKELADTSKASNSPKSPTIDKAEKEVKASTNPLLDTFDVWDIERDDTKIRLKIHRHKIVGFTAGYRPDDYPSCPKRLKELPNFLQYDVAKHKNSCLGVVSTGSLTELHAKHFFSAFMWAISKHAADNLRCKLDDTDQSMPPGVGGPDTWSSLRLSNSAIKDLARKISETGLGQNSDDALLQIIPALSYYGKLPATTKIIQRSQELAISQMLARRWEEAYKTYKSLLLTSQTFGHRKKYLIQAIALYSKFYLNVEEELRVSSDVMTQEEVAALKKVKGSLEVDIRKLDKKLMRCMWKLFSMQKEFSEVVKVLNPENWETQSEDNKNDSETAQEKKPDADGAGGMDDDVLEIVADTLQWDESHKSAALSSQKTPELVERKEEMGRRMAGAKGLADKQGRTQDLMRGNMDRRNARNDFLKRTALHYAIICGKKDVVEQLLQREESSIFIDAQDIFGWTALQYAAWVGIKLSTGSSGTKRNSIVDVSSKVELSKERTLVSILQESRANKDIRDYFGRTALLLAASRGNTKEVEQLLLRGAAISAKSYEGYTALHLAARGNHLETVQVLLENKADVEARSGNGSTPLHIAAPSENSKITFLLLQYKADPRSKDGAQRTALHIAVSKRRPDTVRVLLGTRTESHMNLLLAEDIDGRTPLHLAATSPDAECLELILEYLKEAKAKLDDFAKVADEIVNKMDHQKETALHIAARVGSMKSITLLHDNGAQGGLGNIAKLTPLHIACGSDFGTTAIVKYLIEKFGLMLLALTDGEGYVPLHHAAMAGNVEIVRFILDGRWHHDSTKKDPAPIAPTGGEEAEMSSAEQENSEDGKGTDGADNDAGGEVMASAAQNKNEISEDDDSNKDIEASTDEGTEIGADEHSGLEEGQGKRGEDYDTEVYKTAVYVATVYGQLSVVKLLVEYGVPPESSTVTAEGTSSSATFAAAFHGHAEVFDFLISSGASVEGPNPDSQNGTLLHQAIVARSETAFNIILAKNPDVEALRASTDLELEKDRPLHLVARHVHLEEVAARMIEKLLNHGADINSKSGWLRRPIQIAIEENNMPVVEALLARGADINSPGRWRFNVDVQKAEMPLLACTFWYGNYHMDMLKFLLKKVASAKESINEKDFDGWTCLHGAAFLGKKDYLQVFLENGGDVTATDNLGRTALANTGAGALEAEQTYELIKLLLDYGSDVNQRSQIFPFNNAALDLQMECMNFSHEAMQLLVDRGLEINYQNALGITALYTAILYSGAEHVEVLLKAGANVALHDHLGKTPFHMLVRYLPQHEHNTTKAENRMRSAKLLLEQGSSFKDVDYEQSSVLHAVIAYPSVFPEDFLSEILESNIEILEHADAHGWTPRMIAESYGSKKVIEILDHLDIPKSPAPVGPCLIDGWYTNFPASLFEVKGTHVSHKEDELTLHPFLGASIRSNFPIGFNAIYYFEITIDTINDVPLYCQSSLRFGLVDSFVFRTKNLLGHYKCSWAYDVRDGFAISHPGTDRQINSAPGNLNGDTLGCGILDGTVYFTVNGKFLSAPFEGVRGKLFPCVSLSPGDSVTANFGASEFKFNVTTAELEELIAKDIRQRAEEAATAERANSPEEESKPELVDKEEEGEMADGAAATNGNEKNAETESEKVDAEATQGKDIEQLVEDFCSDNDTLTRKSE